MEIYDAFRTAKVPLFAAYYRRSLPRFTKIKEWIDNKEIGDVRHINWNFFRTASPTDLSKDYNWRTDANVAVSGYFEDMGSHGIDLIEYYVGNIVEVSSVFSNQQMVC